ncbi:helix-turn-helix domain-containing protein [Fulvimarina sp. MAC8]|uniref:helix-turn-helix domain-containing protein n=1 Tax=Fulvimarina sp. MAC8 TaxID=3162874 RepID=UPI0032EAE9A2
MIEPDTTCSVLTIPEAARCLKVSERTIARLIADGQLHAPKVRRRRLISRTSIERLLVPDPSRLS